MNFIKKNSTVILAITVIVLLIGSVFVWNRIVDWQNKKKEQESKESEIINPLDINNVNNVDSKLNGEDYKITQLYLLSYTKHKSGIWYMSNGYVSKIRYNGNEAIITLKENKESKDTLIATINKDKVEVRTGDTINFVGTIDIDKEEIHLSKISKDTINYASVTEISFDELIKNIRLFKDTYFVIQGFMVTENEKYKLFDSKDEYTKDSNVTNYFLLNWKDEFKYTGNQNVTVRCQIKDTYVLHNCSLIQ